MQNFKEQLFLYNTSGCCFWLLYWKPVKCCFWINKFLQKKNYSQKLTLNFHESWKSLNFDLGFITRKFQSNFQFSFVRVLKKYLFLYICSWKLGIIFWHTWRLYSKTALKPPFEIWKEIISLDKCYCLQY